MLYFKKCGFFARKFFILNLTANYGFIFVVFLINLLQRYKATKVKIITNTITLSIYRAPPQNRFVITMIYRCFR